jgi:hypothetical protein
MYRILKNYSKKSIKINFRGHDVYFKAKAGVKFNLDDEEERALYNFWKERYGFIGDITVNVKVGENI